MANYDNNLHVNYEALPVTNDEHIPSAAIYNSPSGDLSAYHTPTMHTSELGSEDMQYNPDLPSGAAYPRFLAAAQYDDQRGDRQSYASSQYTFPATASEYNSVYALDPSGAARRYQDDPGGVYHPGEYAVPMSPMGVGDRSRFLQEKDTIYSPPRENLKRKFTIIAIVLGLVVLVLAIGIPVYLLMIKPKSQKPASAAASTVSSKSSPTSSPTASSTPVSGGDGSVIMMEDGTTFVYRNPFGGRWYYDEKDPFNNGAKAQSWTPALNETFRYGIDQIRG